MPCQRLSGTCGCLVCPLVLPYLRHYARLARSPARTFTCLLSPIANQSYRHVAILLLSFAAVQMLLFPEGKTCKLLRISTVLLCAASVLRIFAQPEFRPTRLTLFSFPLSPHLFTFDLQLDSLTTLLSSSFSLSKDGREAQQHPSQQPLPQGLAASGQGLVRPARSQEEETHRS